MSEKPKDKVTRFSLITDQGHLIVFDGGKCESDHTQSSGWEIIIFCNLCIFYLTSGIPMITFIYIEF